MTDKIAYKPLDNVYFEKLAIRAKKEGRTLKWMLQQLESAYEAIETKEVKEVSKNVSKEINCKYGLECKYFKQGTCKYNHEKKSEKIHENTCEKSIQKVEMKEVKSEKINGECNFGIECKYLKAGNCRYELHNNVPKKKISAIRVPNRRIVSIQPIPIVVPKT